MPPIILDISRSVSRISRGRLTGIDRVELAYIEHFLDWPKPVGFLARFRRYNVLLDREGMRILFTLLRENGPWDEPDIIGKMRQNRRLASTKVETTLRRLSVSWSLKTPDFGKLVPDGFTYLNVGHGTFRSKFWEKLRAANVGKIMFMVHDVIPLDYPQYCDPKSVETFKTEFRAAVEHADMLIFNSTDTKDRTQRWLQKWGCDVDGHVILLGTDALPETSEIVPPNRPYFVIAGTIEPRKNHRLLLDIWADFHNTLPGDDIPHLYIVGARGWLNQEVFAILEEAPFMGVTVHEVGRISDAELGTLIANANALLFPSFAEGFGYPIVEAMQLNTPVICSDLPCFAEIGDDFPTFINPKKLTTWSEHILNSTTQNGNVSKTRQKTPNWPEHFHKLTTILD